MLDSSHTAPINRIPGGTSGFAELGAGNAGLDVKAVLQGLRRTNYDGWISVELDHPRYEP